VEFFVKIFMKYVEFDKVNLTVKATGGGTGISMGAVIARN